MTNRSKSVRIFAEDDSALEELTRLLRRTGAEVVHEALAEYLVHHRQELTQLYEQTQKAIAAGDLAALARASAAAREAEVDAIMAGWFVQLMGWLAARSIPDNGVQEGGNRVSRVTTGQESEDHSGRGALAPG